LPPPPAPAPLASDQETLGRTTSLNTTFKSLPDQPGSMPNELLTQARSPTVPFGPMVIEPLGPVVTCPAMSPLATERTELVMVLLVTTSPPAFLFSGS